jgi:hypothetical protein
MISPSSHGMSSFPDESEQVVGIDELMNFAEKSHTKVEHTERVIQRRPGRPQELCKHSNISYSTIQIDTILKERIDLEQKPGERNADTLNRILKEKTDVIKGLGEEIERLKTIIQTNGASLE